MVKRQKAPEAPKTLSREAREWWARLVTEYAIDDAAGCLVLRTALEALDRMRGAQAILKVEGMATVDRFGQPRTHPATVVERDSRAAMLAALKALNLDLEPLREGPGRPGGR